MVSVARLPQRVFSALCPDDESFCPHLAAAALPDDVRADLGRHVETARKALIPASLAHPGDAVRRYQSALVLIAARVQPSVDGKACAAWARETSQALERQPHDLVMEALREARLNLSLRFLNEVAPFIDGYISERMNRRRQIAARLELLARAAAEHDEREARRKAIEADPVDPQAVDALLRNLGASLSAPAMPLSAHYSPIQRENGSQGSLTPDGAQDALETAVNRS